MRKRKKGRKLNREKDQRRALLRTLASALFLREKIKTTEAKAKEVAGFAEKLITLAKKKDLTSQRKLSGLFSPALVKKMITEIAPRYKARKGGYTSIVKIGQRQSDGARVAFIELVKQQHDKKTNSNN